MRVRWSARASLVLFALASSCGGDGNAVPTSPAGPPTVVSLRITGLPEACDHRGPVRSAAPAVEV